jgi:hypothetical protein
MTNGMILAHGSGAVLDAGLALVLVMPGPLSLLVWWLWSPPSQDGSHVPEIGRSIVVLLMAWVAGVAGAASFVGIWWFSGIPGSFGGALSFLMGGAAIGGYGAVRVGDRWRLRRQGVKRSSRL